MKVTGRLLSYIAIQRSKSDQKSPTQKPNHYTLKYSPHISIINKQTVLCGVWLVIQYIRKLIGSNKATTRCAKKKTTTSLHNTQCLAVCAYKMPISRTGKKKCGKKPLFHIYENDQLALHINEIN